MRLSRTALLALLLGLQVVLLGFVLAYFASTQDAVRMPLEARPPEEEVEPHLSAAEVLDKVSLLSGPEFLGIDFPTRFRRGLVFEGGQFMWFLAGRRLSPSDGLLARAREVMEPQEYRRLEEGATDGVLSFFYDLGARKDLVTHNWGAVGVRELQASPLLPWNKRLDFVALSTLSDTTVGGLGYLTAYNQGIVMVLPPHDPRRLTALGVFSRAPNAVVVPAGLHELGPGLRALVLPVPASRGVPDTHELDLLVDTRDGRLLLFAGSGLNRPLDALRRARALAGRAPDLYVGATGYITGWDATELQAELAELAVEFPDLVMMPNASTTMVAHGAVESVLGPRYRPGRLGTRLDL